MSTRPVNLTGRDGTQVTAAQASRMYSEQTRKIMGFDRVARPPLKAFTTPEFFLFNVGPETHTWSAPGFAPIHIPACPKDAAHSEAVPIFEEYAEEYLGLNNKTELAWYRGFEIADAVLQVGAAMPPSNSLLRKGFFYTKNNPPLPEEVEAAKARLNGTYTALVQAADAAEAARTPKEINEESRRAAIWLGVKADWSKKYSPTIECPNCGEPVSATMGLHNGAGGCGAIVNEERARKLFPTMFMEETPATEVEKTHKGKEKA